MSPAEPEDPLPPPDDVADGLREIREAARKESTLSGKLPDVSEPIPSARPLPSLDSSGEGPAPASPDREEINRIWDVSSAVSEPRRLLGRLLSPFRSALRRLLGFGPLFERQVAVNSALVRFDNELVHYLDERFDRTTRHYDRVLGLHGKRMEEIDERHLILQQELVRHVHDLVQRIEFVFETAEQNHLYLEGMLRESREELKQLSERLAELSGKHR